MIFTLRRLGFELIFDEGNWDCVEVSKLARISFKDATLAFNEGMLFENCKCLAGFLFGSETFIKGESWGKGGANSFEYFFR